MQPNVLGQTDWLVLTQPAYACTGPPSLLKVLAAQPNNGAALFKFSLPQATDGVAAAASGGLDGLNLITRRDRYGKSASQPSNNQVHKHLQRHVNDSVVVP